MATTVGTASRDLDGDLCFLLLFRDMAFFRFNFGAAMTASGVMAAAVTTDGAGASAVKMDEAWSWLPSHCFLLNIALPSTDLQVPVMSSVHRKL